MAPTGGVARTIKGVAVSALNQVLTGTQTVILVPFFMQAWGTHGYGQWLALSAAASYVALVDLGGQTYVGNLLAIAHGQSDEAGFRRHLSEAMSLFLAIGLAALVGVILLLGISVGLLGGTRLGLLPWQASVLATLAATILLFSVPMGIYVTAYAASGRYARAATIGNLQRAAGIVTAIGLLTLRVRPTTFAMGSILVPALSTAFFWWDSRRCIGGCQGLELSIAAAKRGRRYLKGSFQFWLINLSSTAKQEGVVIILAAVGGAAAVAVYTTHRIVASITDYVRVFIQTPVTPELSFLWARNRVTELTRVMLTVIRGVVLMTGGLAVFLWFTAPVLYPIWTREGIGLSRPTLAILLVQAVLAAGWRTSTWGLLASNNQHKLVAWFTANSLLSIILTLLLVRPYGVLGVVIGGLVSDLLLGVAIAPALLSSFLGIPMVRIYSHFGAAVVALVPLVGTAFVARQFLQGMPLVIAVAMIAALLSYPMAALVLGQNEIRRLTQSMTSMIWTQVNS